MGIEPLMRDPRFQTLSDRFANYSLMLAEFEKVAPGFDSNTLVSRLEAEDVPCAKVNTFDEVLQDPRVAARQSIIEYDHPKGGRMRQARAPAIFAGEACPVRLPAPDLGEHTAALLAEVGASAADIEALRTAGAIS
jgi:crotonobetainyl-CoA:carnitine CoA-transferase CaiB-like acyl-CoA transferase